MRKLITGKTNEADITYELPFCEDQLTSKDKVKLFKLLKRIQEGKSISEKISKSFHDTRKIPLILIVDIHECRRDIFTLLHYARFCKNKQAENDLLEEAKKHGLFEEFNRTKIVSEYLGSHEKPVRTYSDVEDGIVRVKDFYDGNKKKVLNPNITIQDTSTGDMSADTRLCAGNEEVKNSSKKMTMRESMDCNVSWDAEEVKINVEEQEEAINITETDTKLYEDINKDNEDFQPTFESMENEILSKEKANLTKRLIKVDWSLLRDPFFRGDFYETAIKHKNSRNVEKYEGDAVHVIDKATSAADENQSTKITQQRRAILAGGAGIMLLISSIVSYILKMNIIAVVGSIAGLACISFALYDTLKPNTKLEKVESVDQPNVKYQRQEVKG